MYKYHHGILPPALDDLFLSNGSVYSRFTRQLGLIHVPARTPIMSKTVRVTGVTIYHYFNNRLTIAMLYDSYKFNLKMYIRDNDISDILQYDE